MCYVKGGDTWTAKQHHWKSEEKEDHQLRPDDLTTDESSGSNQLQ